MNKKVLMVYPEFPETFWSFKESLGFVGKKTNFPPLPLLTVAALLPAHYEVRLADMNVGPLTQADLDWAEFVFISAMLVQKDSMEKVIARARESGKVIVAGGPYPTQCRATIEGVDHFVLNEAEITLPSFIADLEAGRAKPLYTTNEKPDLALTPKPRYDLVDFRPYSSMVLQYSRGCPNECEFCDIVELFGRNPRVKSPGQFLGEMETLYDLGHRGGIFIVDDNFIGNRVAVKELLRAIIAWQEGHGRPFTFSTEASVDLAKDEELLDLMVKSGFTMAFVGIETPVLASLESAHKTKNIGVSLLDAVRKIQESGIEVTAGFIVGFDSDPDDIAERQIAFIQESGITTAMVGLLTALPNTKLHRRLVAEGRLLAESTGNNTHGLELNFVPKMDVSRLVSAYAQVLTTIYDPRRYFERCQVLLRRLPRRAKASANVVNDRSTLTNIRALFGSLVRQSFSPYGRHYLRFLGTTLVRRPWMFAKAIEKAIEGHSLIRTTKAKIGRPWAQARDFGLFLGHRVEAIERLVGGRPPADLAKVLAETRALRVGLSKIVDKEVPVPVLVHSGPPLRLLSDRVSRFVADRGEQLLRLVSEATEEQLRRFAASIASYRRHVAVVQVLAPSAQGPHAAIVAHIGALDAMIDTIGAFVESKISGEQRTGRK